MKRNGFVFIESVIVLMVVALSLTMLISSYSLITRKTQEKEYYDRASDKYLLYSITNIGVNDECNYSLANSCGYEGINLQADEKNCNNTRVGKLLYNCSQTFKDMNIRHIYVVDDIKKELSQDDAVEKYDNGVIEYMKTLKKCNDADSKTCNDPISYMIGVFYRSGNYYYSSIRIDAITEECEDGYYLSSVTKKCEKIEYVIKFDKQEGSGGTSSIKVSTGNKPGNISVPSKNGYTFLGYFTEKNGGGDQYYDSDGKAIMVFNKTQNLTLYAYWVQSVYTFAYKGSEYEFIAPATGTYKIELWGAQGGQTKSEKSSTLDSEGGKGGYTTGNILLNKGEKLYVYVGENKNMPNATSFNAGTSSSGGYSGGGATDVRLTNGAWNNFNSLKSRIMVAAGGGSGVDGYGGGLVGGIGKVSVDTYRSTAATQISPGITKQRTACNDGKFGIGGNCAGGGGGYYGGAGSYWTYGGGSGGSSFISGYLGCKAISSTSTENNITHLETPNHYSGKVFTETQMIAGNTSMPKPDGGTEVGHTGNGYARVTIINLQDNIDKTLIIKKNNKEINRIQLAKNTSSIIEKETDSTIIACNNGIIISEETGKIKLDNILFNNSVCEFSNSLSDIVSNIDDSENSIFLLNNLNLNNRVTLNQNKQIIIDMNGKSINASVTSAIVNNSNLTIKNSNDISSSIKSPGSVVVNNENATLNLDNVRIISNDTTGSAGTVPNHGKLIIKKCYIEGPFGIGYNDTEKSTFDIYDSEIIGTVVNGINLNTNSLSSGGSIYNSTVTGKNDAINSDSNGIVNIYSSTCIGQNSNGVRNGSSGTINICSGEINGTKNDIQNISTGTVNYTSKVTLKNNKISGINVNLNDSITCN